MKEKEGACTKNKEKKRWLKKILLVLLFTFCLFGLMIGVLLIDSFVKFPDLRKRIESTNYLQEYIVLDYKEHPIPQAIKYRKLPTEYREIPQKVIDTLLIVEDKNFFNHHGVDIISTIRAIILLPFFIVTKRRPMGASTITQQCIRTIFLDMRYSYIRKVRELILSLRLEWLEDKKEILNCYFNNVYFGSGNYGIKSAARYLFNKNLCDLDNEEIALLIGIIKNPSYSLIHRYKDAMERRNYVLDLMYQNKLITEDEYIPGINSPISYRRENTNSQFLHGQHFVQHVLFLSKQYLSSNKNLPRKPLIIRTTLNNKMQQLAEKIILKKMEDLTNQVGQWNGAITNIPILTLRKMSKKERLNFLDIYEEKKTFRNGLYLAIMTSKNKNVSLLDNGESIKLAMHRKKYNEQINKGDVFLVLKTKQKTYIPYQIPIFHCALVIFDGEGKVLTMVGSNSYSHSNYNRAINTKGQIGSVMKVFLLPFLLEKMEPNALLDDSPIEVENPPSDTWIPRNWDNKFNGPITLRNSVSLSRNCSLVRAVVSPEIGMREFAKFCREKLNIKEVYPSTILGATDLSLIELGTCLIPLTNGGYKKSMKFIHEITCEDNINKTPSPINNILWQQNHEKGKKLYNEDVLFQTYKILSDTKKSGLSKNLKIKPHCACKSGTSNDRKRAIFIAYGKNWSIVCAIARDDNQDIKLMGNASSGTLVAAILNAFYEENLMEFTSVDRPNNIYAVLIDKESGAPLGDSHTPLQKSSTDLQEALISVQESSVPLQTSNISMEGSNIPLQVWVNPLVQCNIKQEQPKKPIIITEYFKRRVEETSSKTKNKRDQS